MDFLNNIKWLNVLKVAGLALVGVVLVAIAFRLIGSSFGSFGRQESMNISMAPGSSAYDMGMGYGGEMNYKYAQDGDYELSVRNVMGEMPPMPPMEPDVIAGDNAEDFEVTEYSASVETRNLNRDCTEIAGLKSRDYVIFENANEYDRGCNYTFKVKQANVDEILSVVQGLKPKDFSESSFTIKKTVEDFTSEEQILLNKLATIDETLLKATSAYDDLTDLATRVQDVESLANIVNSKINIVERLTQERININSRLERLQRSKAEQLDRLEYTYFSVSIYENKFIDFEYLKDSWKSEVQTFIWDINDIVQGVSVQLVTLLLRIAQFALYFAILLVFVKYGWQLVKFIWRK